MKIFKLLIIPLILVFGYLILVSYPYFFSKIDRFSSLGILSLVEEKSEHIKKSGRVSEHLLKAEKITGELRSSENNLGILLVRFSQLSPKVTDHVTFRIKEVGGKKWYFENTYNADQFQPDQYFTFGFPVINDSKDRKYVFEVESLTGTGKNGIGLSYKKPQAAFVYRITKEDLLSLNIFSFIFKKLIYVLTNVDIWQNWPILVGPLFIYLTIKKMPFVKKKRHRIISNYLLLTRKAEKFFKKIIDRFITTKFYTTLLNSNLKKRLAIFLFIFSIAFLYRFSATGQLGVNSFYAGLGGQGDYDQFIRAATCAVRNFCPAILGQNFLIESSILGKFYEIFGFVGGLKVYLYLMIILSSILATLPYIILSRKNFCTVGGIIGGLFLATSDYFTNMALAFPPDNGSIFLFSIFFIVYLFTINIGTIRWLLLFGLMGAIDGLNKLTMLINDIGVLVLFALAFYYEKANKINKFPFVKLNPKLIFYSILPLLIFLVIYSAWELVVQIKFSTPYYLRALIEGGSTYQSSTIAGSISLKESFFKGNVLEILYYCAGSIIVLTKRLIENAGFNVIMLAPIFFGLLFQTFRKKNFFVMKLISIVIFTGFTFLVIELFRNNYLGIQEIGQYVYAWSNDVYINVFMLLTIIFLLILNFKYQAFKLALPIIPYFIMLIILAKNAPEIRLLVHVIAWSIILLSFLIDWILSNVQKNYVLKGLWFGPILLTLFIGFYMIPRTSSMAVQLYSGIINNRNEVKYLKWVNSNIPENAMILLGGKSDLVTVAEILKKPIIYNTQWTAALLIKPNEIPGTKPTDFAILDQLKINEMSGVTPSDFSIVRELKDKDNFKNNKYLILENDIELWRARIAGVFDNVFAISSSTVLHADDYSLKVYKFNSYLEKGLYELKYKEN